MGHSAIIYICPENMEPAVKALLGIHRAISSGQSIISSMEQDWIIRQGLAHVCEQTSIPLPGLLLLLQLSQLASLAAVQPQLLQLDEETKVSTKRNSAMQKFNRAK